jgi:hypothetical protein
MFSRSMQITRQEWKETLEFRAYHPETFFAILDAFQPKYSECKYKSITTVANPLHQR